MHSTVDLEWVWAMMLRRVLLRSPQDRAILNGNLAGDDGMAGLKRLGLGYRRTAIALLLCLVTLSSCGQIARLTATTTPIATAIESAGDTQEIYIRGRVVSQFAFLGQGAYQVEDDSGSIWVTTDSGLPAIDSNVVVKGTTRTGVRIGTRNFGVTLTEIERL
ncbi:hypothetical protein [Synechococcus sp. PCC 7336]|uniref:hypothetical protein n=1 Tax=Synechococcus sp. PCC 7336 TaxID=195250 RepID=UPI00068488D8|nr:hypothetical protein [Synechococcus sp. PCC 7336]